MINEQRFVAPASALAPGTRDPIGVSHNHLELLFNADAIFGRVAAETWSRQPNHSPKDPRAGEHMVSTFCAN